MGFEIAPVNLIILENRRQREELRVKQDEGKICVCVHVCV